MSDTVKISTQGINEGFQANGDYEPVDCGSITKEELLEYLTKVNSMTLLEVKGTEDICPPNVLIEGSSGEFSFTPNNAKLWCNEIQEDLSPEDSVNLAFGDYVAKPASSSEKQPDQAKEAQQVIAEEAQATIIKKRNPLACAIFCVIGAFFAFIFLDNFINTPEVPEEGRTGGLIIMAIITLIFFALAKRCWKLKVK